MIKKTHMLILAIVSGNLFSVTGYAQSKPKIAVFSGSTATIQNTESLVTSNKAREKYGLPLLKNPDGTAIKYDHLAPQRLAAPVEVLIEMFSGHPLEKDAAELYGPPDGYVDKKGNFHSTRQGPEDRPVYKVVLKPEDGLYMLPYMARQADGSAWEDDCTHKGAAEDQCRQPFYPDGSRSFEEIDRGIWGISEKGLSNMLSSKATFDFFRAVPPAGYKKGLPAAERTDMGTGDIPAEVAGTDFFMYKPYHLGKSVRYHDLAKLTNMISSALAAGEYHGAIWFEGSPRVEETVYWLNLIIDTTVPIVGNAAQRPNRALSADGPGNIVDAVDYIVSNLWADENGKDELGAVLIQDEQIIAIRQAQKTDARPGGYTATGDHGGILGTIGKPGAINIYFKPKTLHTWRSQVNLSELPSTVTGIERRGRNLRTTRVTVKDRRGDLIGQSLPRIAIVKQAHFSQDSSAANAEDEVDIMARIDANLKSSPLAGFVAEGTAPYGGMSNAQANALEIAAYSGMPTVRVGRGDAGGLTGTNLDDVFIEGNNLTATKARYLLMACLMKFGSLPIADDPARPSPKEKEAVQQVIAKYQAIFDSH